MAEADRRPEGARAGAAMIGSTSAAEPVAWDERDVMLYALGVGAGVGAPERELALTTENSRGVALAVLPSFLSTLMVGHSPPALAALDAARFLHAEQAVELFRPLPPTFRGWRRTVVEQVWDKGTDAIVTIAGTLSSDEAGADPLGRSRSSIFVRGAGGFGGTRGTSAPHRLPDRAPDCRVQLRTRPEQALLYRLSGDRNPLHSDPAHAIEHGFPRPILHGLCTYGVSCRALVLAAAGGRPDRVRAMAGRFRKPVFPGETLSTEIWADGEEVLFRTLDEAGAAVIEHGRATLSAA